MNNRGYSLVEMLMVVGIIGLMGAAAVPDMVARAPQRRLERASWRVYMDLQQAKARAVSENRPARVSVSTAKGSYSIWVDSNGNGLEDDGELNECVLGEEVSGVQLSAYPSTITLTPSGTMSSSWYFFYLRVYERSGGYRYIYVFPNGHIDPMRVQSS